MSGGHDSFQCCYVLLLRCRVGSAREWSLNLAAMETASCWCWIVIPQLKSARFQSIPTILYTIYKLFVRMNEEVEMLLLCSTSRILKFCLMVGTKINPIITVIDPILLKYVQVHEITKMMEKELGFGDDQLLHKLCKVILAYKESKGMSTGACNLSYFFLSSQ